MRFRYEGSFGTDVGRVAEKQVIVSGRNQEGSTNKAKDMRNFKLPPTEPKKFDGNIR